MLEFGPFKSFISGFRFCCFLGRFLPVWRLWYDFRVFFFVLSAHHFGDYPRVEFCLVSRRRLRRKCWWSLRVRLLDTRPPIQTRTPWDWVESRRSWQPRTLRWKSPAWILWLRRRPASFSAPSSTPKSIEMSRGRWVSTERNQSKDMSVGKIGRCISWWRRNSVTHVVSPIGYIWVWYDALHFLALADGSFWLLFPQRRYSAYFSHFAVNAGGVKNEFRDDAPQC